MNTYNDPLKQESRVVLRTFAATNLAHMRPQDISVLCFAGAEADGEEALEVKEVYDQLHIPRHNIFAIERDRERAQRLQNANLGITVIPEEAQAYLGRTAKRFSIISLDHTGQQKEEELRLLRTITDRRLLKDTAILATVYAGKREAAASKELMRKGKHLGNVYGVMKQMANEGRFAPDIPRDVQHAEAIARADALQDPNAPLTALRDGITFNVFSALAGRSNAIELRLPPQTENIVAQIRLNGLIIPDERLYSRLLENAVQLFLSRAYYVRSLERVSYTSNSNYLMLMDCFAVSSEQRTRDALQRIVRVEPNTLRLQLNPERVGPAKLRRWMLNVLSDYDRFEQALRTEHAQVENTPERRYLGSSWKRRERMRIADVIEFCKSGIAISDLAEQYEIPKRMTREQGLELRDAGITPEDFSTYFGQPAMRVAGWAAHATRRKLAEQA